MRSVNLSAPSDVTLPEERSNYHHLVQDVWWYGLAFAATSRFLSVYAIRLGATPMELGLISSLPAIVLLFSSGLGGWLARRSRDTVKSIFWPAVGFRLAFLLPAFAPFLPADAQPAWLIASVALPAIPQGIAGVMFLVIMRSAIADNHVTSLLSHRMLALNVAIGLAALGFGVWLEQAPFPFNYQAMFVVAFFLSGMSTRHLMKIRYEAKPVVLNAAKSGSGPWRSPQFRRVIGIVMATHIAFTAITAVTPLHLVDGLGASEGFLALFGLAELVAGATVALFTKRIVERLGNRGVIAAAMVGTSLSALVIALSPSLPLTLLAALLSGAAWTSLGIALYGFFTANAPYEGTARYSTAYQQVIGLSMFIGPMIGSTLVTGGVQVVVVLLLGAGLRLLAGALIEHGVFAKVRRTSIGRLDAALRTK